MNVMRKILPLLRPYRLRFIQAAIAMVIVAVCNGGVVLILKPIIDGIFIFKDYDTLYLITIALPCLVALKTTAGYIQN